MRPGQNKRMRGRNNNNNGGGNNRKGPNPLTRSYESNGPDVKIRGTAHHVGEKYLQLARDAQSSGDPVMAESYLQHAEHYFRLIASAQQAQQQAAYGYQRPAGEQAEADDDGDDDDFASLPDRFASPAERVVTPPQPAPQPYAERPAYNGGNGGDRAYEPRPDRNERYERPSQGQERQNGDRQPTQDRPYGERQQGEGRNERFDRDRNQRGDRQPYGDRSFGNRNNQDRSGYQDRPHDRNASEQGAAERNGQPRDNQGRDNGPTRDYDNRGQRNGRGGNREFRDQPRENREPRQPEAEATVSALPAFITAPVRIQPDPVSDPIVTSAAEAPPSAVEAGTDDAGFALRPRRRRRTKAEFAESGSDAPAEVPTPDPVGE